ncbi:MAG TPA: hypothetical protein PLC52_04215 [Anaerolineales bacterium]|nr:hypothetical protein [Anaerolineales bacterium]HRQ92055.1 hypothetical protein [Anaerolineales bacterium]
MEVAATSFAALSSLFSLVQITEIQKQREASERPYIHAYFDDEYTGMLVFKVVNTGSAPALDVKITFDPSPRDYANRKLSTISIFSNPISFIPPGKEYRQLVIQGFNFFKKQRRRKFAVKTTYYSVSGKKYQENTVHDLSFLKHANLAPKQTDGYLKDLAEEHKKITRELASIKSKLG